MASQFWKRNAACRNLLYEYDYSTSVSVMNSSGLLGFFKEAGRRLKLLLLKTICVQSNKHELHVMKNFLRNVSKQHSPEFQHP